MKDIMIKIEGRQASKEAGNDSMEFITEGKLYKRGDTLYMIYDESELAGIPGFRTRIKLKGDEVQMKRFKSGSAATHEIRFRKGEKFTGSYNTPIGAIELEVLTNEIRTSLSESGEGTIDIDYDISLKGLLESRNIINITLM